MGPWLDVYDDGDFVVVLAVGLGESHFVIYARNNLSRIGKQGTELFVEFALIFLSCLVLSQSQLVYLFVIDLCIIANSLTTIDLDVISISSNLNSQTLTLRSEAGP